MSIPIPMILHSLDMWDGFDMGELDTNLKMMEQAASTEGSKTNMADPSLADPIVMNQRLAMTRIAQGLPPQPLTDNQQAMDDAPLLPWTSHVPTLLTDPPKRGVKRNQRLTAEEATKVSVLTSQSSDVSIIDKEIMREDGEAFIPGSQLVSCLTSPQKKNAKKLNVLQLFRTPDETLHQNACFRLAIGEVKNESYIIDPFVAKFENEGKKGKHKDAPGYASVIGLVGSTRDFYLGYLKQLEQQLGLGRIFVKNDWNGVLSIEVALAPEGKIMYADDPTKISAAKPVEIVDVVGQHAGKGVITELTIYGVTPSVYNGESVVYINWKTEVATIVNKLTGTNDNKKQKVGGASELSKTMQRMQKKKW